MVDPAAVEAKLAFRLILTCCAPPVALRRPTGPRYASVAGLPRHRNIQHTVRYTELSANRFLGLWR